MKILRLSIAATVFACLLSSLAEAENAARIEYSEPLRQLSLQDATFRADGKPGETLHKTLQFDAFGQRFDIELAPNYALLNSTKRQALSQQIEVYRGAIVDRPNSWVRLVIADGNPSGMIWDGEVMYAVDVAADDANKQTVIYRLDDLHIAPGTLACSQIKSADGNSPDNAGVLLKAIVGELATVAAQGPGATSQIDLAVIGDFEFTSAKGASAEADMITRINIVDGIFSSQLAVQLNVNQIDTFPAANDPFTDEPDAGNLIDELSDYRNDTPAQNANGLSHLFTGRVLDGTTVGIAFGGALCSRRFGAGLTQATENHTVMLDALIAAHEIGHNFGAPHDGTAGDGCESTPQDFLMAPNLNGSDTFSQCSITEMLDDVAAASAQGGCISPLPSTDVSVTAIGQSGTVLQGSSTTITFAANSVGTNTATNVNLDITVPSAVTLNSVSAAAGSCTSGGGSASCAVGSISAGSGVDVTLDIAADAVATADFVATVTADIDANGNNNQATVQLTIIPSVDLASTAAANVQVNLDQSTTITPSVENRSANAATGVTVTVTPSTGIQIDNASWSPGSCSLAAGAATCQAATFAGMASESLTISLTGTSEGNQSYTVTATANEADLDASNDAATGQVSVVKPQSSGGGGSIGLVTLLLLTLGRLLFARSYRRHG